MTKDNSNLEPLGRAIAKLKQFLPHQKTEQERAGIIQAFEYSFEVSWKALRRILKNRGIEANSPRQVIRDAALEGLISDSELWFNFLEKRNITSHTYNEPDALAVIGICGAFLLEVESFLNKMRDAD